MDASLLLEGILNTRLPESWWNVGEANVSSHRIIFHLEFIWLSLNLICDVFSLFHRIISILFEAIYSMLFQRKPNFETITFSSAR